MSSPSSLLLGPIVGGLSHNGANLWGRLAAPGSLHAWLARKQDLSDAKPAGKVRVGEETGCTGIVPLAKLKPGTTYFYALTTLPGSRPPASEFHSFTTSPAPGELRSFNFVFGSCFLPHNEDGGETFTAIESRRKEEALRFMLLIGDQVYTDVWEKNGLGRVAVSKEDYRKVYEYTWSRPAFRYLLQELPAFMTLDDHEVDDDWRWVDLERRWGYIPMWNQLVRWLSARPPQERHLSLHRIRDALQVYWEHQQVHAPGMELPLRLNFAKQYEMRPHDPGSLAYTFYYGGAAFFVMDTRTMRVRGRQGRAMLGEGQWHVLEEWLLDVKDAYPVKFIVTSSAMLFNMTIDIARDRWSGFPQERERLLQFLAGNAIENVHLIAGDLHSCHAISTELKSPDGRRIPLWEFCSTPFEQKVNWPAPYTYLRTFSPSLGRQKLHFCYAAHNYGIVRVNFDDPAHPRVQFEINYFKNNQWRKDQAGS
jgi:alkaline phosphatase D